MTDQATELIRYESCEYFLSDYPLDLYLKTHEVDVHGYTHSMSSGCWRGYVGTWTIRSSRLYLSKLQDPFGEDLMQIVFKDANLPIFAKWFSGKIQFSKNGPCRWGFREGDTVVSADLINGRIERIRKISGGEANKERAEIDSDLFEEPVGSSSHSQNRDMDCKPLLDVATPELFRTNAFRITGLRVDATTREIAKHADKLKMMEELGQGKSVHTGAFALKTPPSVDQIREAIQRLKEPEQRIIDEFFWFWPRQFGQSASDPAIIALEAGDADTAIEIWESLETHPSEGVVAIHNIAVLWHCMALEWERHYAKADEFTKEQRAEVDTLWRGSFKRWEILAVDDLFWAKVSARIKELDDPRLTTGFARRMRQTLPQALDKINAELAVRYAESGNMVSARVHVAFMRETNQGLDNVEKTAELVLAPAVTQLKQQIERTRERAEKKLSDTTIVVRELLDQARLTLPLYELFFGKDGDTGNDLSDEVANACNLLSIAYQKAKGDDQGCIELLEAALPFAMSEELHLQLEKNIGVLTENVAFKRLEPVHAILKAIQEGAGPASARFDRFQSEALPAISSASRGMIPSKAYTELCDHAAIVLRQISLAAWNEFQDIKTAASANTMAKDYARNAEILEVLSGDRRTLLEMAARHPAQKYPATGNQTGCLVMLGVMAFVVILCTIRVGRSALSHLTPSWCNPQMVTLPAIADAADLMEEAFNKSHTLRAKYAHQLKLWRYGISM